MTLAIQTEHYALRADEDAGVAHFWLLPKIAALKRLTRQADHRVEMTLSAPSPDLTPMVTRVAEDRLVPAEVVAGLSRLGVGVSAALAEVINPMEMLSPECHPVDFVRSLAHFDADHYAGPMIYLLGLVSAAAGQALAQSKGSLATYGLLSELAQVELRLVEDPSEAREILRDAVFAARREVPEFDQLGPISCSDPLVGPAARLRDAEPQFLSISVDTSKMYPDQSREFLLGEVFAQAAAIVSKLPLDLTDALPLLTRYCSGFMQYTARACPAMHEITENKVLFDEGDHQYQYFVPVPAHEGDQRQQVVKHLSARLLEMASAVMEGDQAAKRFVDRGELSGLNAGYARALRPAVSADQTPVSTAALALEAIAARTQEELDHPALLPFGDVTSLSSDVMFITQNYEEILTPLVSDPEFQAALERYRQPLTVSEVPF